MSDIAAFLTARLDEDEQRAGAAGGGRYGLLNHRGHRPGWSDLAEIPVRRLAEYSDEDDASFEHIARHDPARVLAEVAAKRAILKRVHHAVEVGIRGGDQNYVSCSCGWEHELVATKDWDMFADPHLADVGFNEALRDDVLRALVRPYADHPDYDPAWSVDS